MPGATAQSYQPSALPDSFQVSNNEVPYIFYGWDSLPPLEADDINLGFTTESAVSPSSMMDFESATPSSLPLEQDDEFPFWDEGVESPEGSSLYQNQCFFQPGVSPASIASAYTPQQIRPATPAVNPAQLTQVRDDRPNDRFLSGYGSTSNSPPLVIPKKSSHPVSRPAAEPTLAQTRPHSLRQQMPRRVANPSASAQKIPKRKSSSDTSSDRGTSTCSAPKSRHNLIEKRYRESLNGRMAELRDAVPELRRAGKGNNSVLDDGAVVKTEREGDSPAQQEDSPLCRVGKATILTKATEYIHTLERENHVLSQKCEMLLARLQGFGGAGGDAARWGVEPVWPTR